MLSYNHSYKIALTIKFNLIYYLFFNETPSREKAFTPTKGLRQKSIKKDKILAEYITALAVATTGSRRPGKSFPATTFATAKKTFPSATATNVAEPAAEKN
jgi:hypothetical protein